MKININREKYHSHDCPQVPKETWDIFYSKLMMVVRHRLSEKIKTVDLINIRVNQAYLGSNSFHFYISINGSDEIHTKISNYDEPRYTSDNKQFNKLHPRGKWLIEFEEYLNLDVGEHKIGDKIKSLREVLKEKGKTSSRVKKLRHSWEQYNKLKEFFEA